MLCSGVAARAVVADNVMSTMYSGFRQFQVRIFLIYLGLHAAQVGRVAMRDADDLLVGLLARPTRSMRVS